MRSTLAAFFVIGIAGCAVGMLLPTPPAAAGSTTPVLVELFTSEGCSSCPPADEVASRLVRNQPVAGARVIVLAHHVDYWNQLGWPDPFSSSASTARQRSYAPLGGGNYTPQAVVDGQREMVGSRGGSIEDAIAATAKRLHARVEIDVAPASRGAHDITVRVGPLPEGTAESEVLVALVQDRGHVVVPRGENGGRTLDHVAIARSLRTVGLATKDGGTVRTAVRLPALVSAPDGSAFSVVAFVQERASRRIVGTAAGAFPRP